MRRRTLAVAGAALVLLLAAAGEASAAACDFQGPGTTWEGANWSCVGGPTSNDSVTIGSGDAVTVSSAANAGSLSLTGGGSITFSGDPTLAVAGAMSTTGGTLGGTGQVTVGGAYTQTAGSLFINDSADLVLNGASSIDGGQIGMGEAVGADPNLHINNTLTIGSGATTPFGHSTSSTVPRIHVNAPNGHLVTTATATSQSVIENDDTITAQAGTFTLIGGTGTTSEGAYLADADATIQLAGGNYALGATGRLGGAGTIHANALNVVLPDGATLDPAILQITGVLIVGGSSALALPDVRLTGGTLNSTRPLTPTSLSVTGGTLTGSGGLTVPNGGSFSKTTAGILTLADGTLAFDLDVTWDAGDLSVSGGGNPQVQINRTFTIADGAPAAFLGATSGPRIHVNAPNGHLVKAAAGTISTGTGIDNDDTITVLAGTLNLGGATGAETSNGAYIANAGTTLGFQNNISVGATGRVGGAGTVNVSGLNLTLAAGATLDPAVLNLVGVGFLDLNGTTPAVTLPVLNIDGGGFQPSLDSERSVTATALSVTSGAIRGNFVLTVPSNGSFSKTTSGSFNVTNSGAQGSADLVLDVDATLTGGSIFVAHDGSSPGDLPHLEINKQFTIGAGATPNAFPGSGTRIDVNGPDGHLLWAGSGTTTTDGAINVDGGTVTIGAGQTFAVANGISQSAGLTDIASTGVLQGAATLTGGVLRGSGQVTGNVTNTAGTVRPGTSPGTLTIGGNYTQGPAGTLEVDVTSTAQGTDPGYDHLDVSGAATLDGTLAVLQGGGFDPDPLDTFQFLTSASRTGTFSAITGASLPSGDTYVLDYPGSPDFGAQLVVNAVQAPQNTTPPSIPATATVGDVVSCDPGLWTGLPSFGFQWMRDGAAIVGATSQNYAVDAEDVGRAIQCQVTATNGGGSASADSNALVPTAPAGPAPGPAAPSSPAPPVTPPAEPTQTLRGEQAFSQGTPNDLYLACTKLDLLLIDVLPAGRKRVAVTGSADLRLAGRTADILLDGKPVGKAPIAANGSFARKVAAPSAKRRRKARYQARVGTTRSQRLQLERRMIATTLTRAGRNLTLRGAVSKPFAKRPAAIEVQRFVACGRLEKVVVRRVVPNSRGAFAVTFPAPAAGSAAIYRARTRVATRNRGPATAPTFTLPRAIALG